MHLLENMPFSLMLHSKRGWKFFTSGMICFLFYFILASFIDSSLCEAARTTHDDGGVCRSSASRRFLLNILISRPRNYSIFPSIDTYQSLREFKDCRSSHSPWLSILYTLFRVLAESRMWGMSPHRSYIFDSITSIGSRLHQIHSIYPPKYRDFVLLLF